MFPECPAQNTETPKLATNNDMTALHHKLSISSCAARLKGRASSREALKKNGGRDPMNFKTTRPKPAELPQVS